jgi:hypothetical protein
VQLRANAKAGASRISLRRWLRGAPENHAALNKIHAAASAITARSNKEVRMHYMSKAHDFLIAVAAFAIAALISTTAFADFVHFKSNESTVRKDCFANGGEYSASSTGYGCKKGINQVSCDSHGNCQGYCPNCSDTRGGVKGVKGVLHAPSAGIKSSDGKTKVHRPPVKVGGVKITKGHRSHHRAVNINGLKKSNAGKKQANGGSRGVTIQHYSSTHYSGRHHHD